MTIETMATKPTKCPRCNSPKPKLHPAVQVGGEVQICPDAFHDAKAPTMDAVEAVARAIRLATSQAHPAQDWHSVAAQAALAAARPFIAAECAKVVAEHDVAWARKQQQAKSAGHKGEARDFQTMCIAAVTIATAIKETIR
jgi:hypothetical protein